MFGLGLGDRGISGPAERRSVLRVGRLRSELWLSVLCDCSGQVLGCLLSSPLLLFVHQPPSGVAFDGNFYIGLAIKFIWVFL